MTNRTMVDIFITCCFIMFLNGFGFGARLEEMTFAYSFGLFQFLNFWIGAVRGKNGTKRIFLRSSLRHRNLLDMKRKNRLGSRFFRGFSKLGNF